MKVSFKVWRVCIIENALHDDPIFRGLRKSCYFDGKGYKHIFGKYYWLK